MCIFKYKFVYINDMVIKYHTQNLNKHFVNQTVLHTLANVGIRDLSGWIKKWDIHVWNLKDTNPQFFEHIETTSGQRINPDMPSGVTGKYRMDLWLHDSSNVFKLRENSDRIMHEVCHAVLIGTKHFVSGVHDNVGNRFNVKFWYWNKYFWRRMQLSIIDIRKFM